MASQTALVAKQYRLMEWANMIRDCNSRPAGMTVGEWCEQHSITKCDYYYRMKMVRKACLDQAQTDAVTHTIVPVPSSLITTDDAVRDGDTDSIELKAHGISLVVTGSTSEELLRKVIGVLADVK